jgi:multidrug efflux pump subunit AcrA (membrane-fusion protein)
VITAVNVQPGETAAGVVVEMVDPDSLEAVLQVDEIDIAQVALGQPAEVTVETWPDDEISADVLAVVPRPVSDTDLVVYEVYLGLGQTDLALRAGMTADATLTTGELTDALLLPSEAIEVDRTRGTYSVRRVTTGLDGEEIEEVVEVTIGRRSGGFTQITAGLEAGDEVIIESSLPLDGIPQPGDGDGQGGPLSGLR